MLFQPSTSTPQCSESGKYGWKGGGAWPRSLSLLPPNGWSEARLSSFILLPFFPLFLHSFSLAFSPTLPLSPPLFPHGVWHSVLSNFPAIFRCFDPAGFAVCQFELECVCLLPCRLIFHSSLLSSCSFPPPRFQLHQCFWTDRFLRLSLFFFLLSSRLLMQ